MTTEKQIEEIRAACIKANPEIVGDWSGCDVCGAMCSGMCDAIPASMTARPIHLADVLLAIEKKMPSGHWIIAMKQLCFYDTDDCELGFWNLRTDDLTKQSEETLAFIHSLIAV